MKARDVMTRNVVSISPVATVLEAAQMMLEHRISGLPVVEGGKLVGMLSEGDFLRRQETQTQRRRSRWLQFLIGPGRMAEEYTHTHGNKVSEVMTTALQTATEDTSLEDVVRLMEKHHIKRVPVVRGDRIVGIITRANLMHAIVGLARGAKPVTASDAAIREQLMKIMEEETWAPAAMVDVQVHDGVVELWGTILDERQRDALTVAAENVAGVKAVKDHLAWVEPFSGTVVESSESASAR